MFLIPTLMYLACNKNDKTTDNSPEITSSENFQGIPINLDSAKNSYLNERVASATSDDKSGDKNEGDSEPQWDKTKQLWDGENFIEVPLKKGKYQVHSTLFETRDTSNNVRLMTLRLNGNLKSMYVHYIPIQTYKTDLNLINWSNLNKMKFDGYVVFEDLNHVIRTGAILEKGRITKNLIPNNKSTKFRGGGLQCVEFRTQSCGQSSYIDGNGVFTVSWSCGPVIYQQFCYDDTGVVPFSSPGGTGVDPGTNPNISSSGSSTGNSNGSGGGGYVACTSFNFMNQTDGTLVSNTTGVNYKFGPYDYNGDKLTISFNMSIVLPYNINTPNLLMANSLQKAFDNVDQGYRSNGQFPTKQEAINDVISVFNQILSPGFFANGGGKGPFAFLGTKQGAPNTPFSTKPLSAENYFECNQ